MGPFSNNTPPPISPAPRGGNKLPVPDVEGTPQPVVVSTEPDNSLATKKWFTITLALAGIMAAAGLVVFAIYAYISNTPGYMLSAAMQNLLTSNGEAGTIYYEVEQERTRTTIEGDFLAYTDPTNSHAGALTLSLGKGASKVSGTVRLFADGNYVQTAGLGNLGRFIDSVQGDSSLLTPDRLTQLSNLDGQWYMLTSDDANEPDSPLPHQMQNGPSSADIEEVGRLYQQHAFLTSAQQLGDERIDNINTTHLKLGVDSAKLTQFLRALKDAHIQSLALSDSDIQALSSGQVFGLANANVEVWISKSDRAFQQVRVTRPQSNSISGTLTITFHSELAAAQRQSVLRPESPKSASVLLHGLHTILSAPTSAAP